jgi:GH15 family glucan-1,4-alpha-glucosidase
VYGIGLERDLPEHTVDTLAGYRGERPVRVGIPAGEHPEHDAYGSVVLAVTQAFFDLRLREPAHVGTFRLLESLGERAWEHRETPDRGLWGFGDPDRVNTHSSTMCWAACDRLARIAGRLGQPTGRRTGPGARRRSAAPSSSAPGAGAGAASWPASAARTWRPASCSCTRSG